MSGCAFLDFFVKIVVNIFHILLFYLSMVIPFKFRAKDCVSAIIIPMSLRQAVSSDGKILATRILLAVFLLAAACNFSYMLW